MAWHLAPALAVLRAEVDARWPRRDKTSDGTVGDAAHAATRSDHNPNGRESVDAWDMDRDGVDVDEVIAAFQKHPSAHYWIWQRQIADKDDGWRRRPYGGSNPHTMHVHFSVRQTEAAELDTRSWGLLEDDVTISDSDAAKIAGRVWAATFGSETAGGRLAELVAAGRALLAAATADAQRDAELRALVEQHTAGALDAEDVVRRMGELLTGAPDSGA